MLMSFRRHLAQISIALLVTTAIAGDTVIDSTMLSGLRARSIGPATMSGRIAAIDAVREQDRGLTIWVGAASGGVWKSTDGGVRFESVFDDHPQSIGDLMIDPSDPNTVWVGTGEANVRNSVAIGRGVWKTSDGGDTWTHLGLEETHHIARVVVSPKSSDTAWVCAVGHLFSSNEDRGVFLTTDGGATWERVLYVDDSTGCSDLAVDPDDPRIVYAGMWQVRRLPWTFTSGGPGSGLYKSVDGGVNWKKVTAGLPQGDLGRIGIGIAPSRPSTLYANVEAKKTAMYRSDDFGETWEEVNSSFNVQVRPFYFGDRVVVDPTDRERVYKPGLFLTASSDGGKTFPSIMSMFSGGVHPDHHALWINPADRNHLLLGTDGGVYESHDRGSRWRFIRSLPVSQFYQVSHDMAWPYNVYGGLQDNGTWMGPSRARGGIENRDWTNIGGGDGFHAYADPTDEDLVYVEYQGGNIFRIRKSTGESRDIRPYPEERQSEYRFNWNTPIHLSRVNPGTIYFGSQVLFRSTDRGDSWQTISPDLTTNDPSKQQQKQSGGLSIDNSTAENHTTIYAIGESPRNGEVIWVGTDDGNLQVTRNAGESWTNVVGSIPALPQHTWVSSVEPSHHDEATAYASFDGHRTGDLATYLYRTRDFGASWESIATEQIDGYVWVIREDPVNPELLFTGTEYGLYVSFDGGGNWARIPSVPMVPVHALAIHPRDHDLIVGTHGRGIYIIDDITPLRHLTSEVVDRDVAMFPSRPAIMVAGAPLQQFGGDDEFVGANPMDSAQIVYYLKKRHIFGDLRIEIIDQDDTVVATMPGGRRRGLNRVDWPMRLKAPTLPAATTLVPAFEGPRMLEGTYRVQLVKGNDTYESEVVLAADPRSVHSPEDRRLQQELALDVYHRLADLTWLIDSIADAREQAHERGREASPSLRRRLEGYAAQLEALRTGLVATSEAGWLSGDEKLREKLGNLYGGVNGYDGRPTATQLQRKRILFAELEAANRELEKLTGTELDRLNAQLERAKLDPIRALSREEWTRRREEGGSASSVGVALDPRYAGRFVRRFPLFVPMQ
jgi:photosystem II stability/assembly factor-like uncharacterized protein